MKNIPTFEEFLNESIDEPINEDMATSLMYLLLAANTTMLWTTALAGQGGGDFTPIQDLKNWWAKRKRDKAVQSIVNKLKDDPDVAAFMNQSNSAQRGKWYKLIEPKLNDEEKKYLRSISKSSFKGTGISESEINEGTIMSFYYSKKSSEIEGDVEKLKKQAQEFIKMARDKDYNISSNDSVLYFPNFTWARGKQVFGPSLGILAGSETMLVSPIGSNKIYKFGESLLVRFIKDGRIESYNLY